MFIVRFIITMIIITIIISIGNFLLNGINRIKTGIIVDKNYSPGYNKTTPAMYMLAIQGEKRGKIVTYWKTVSKDEYHRYDIGMQYP